MSTESVTSDDDLIEALIGWIDPTLGRIRAEPVSYVARFEGITTWQSDFNGDFVKLPFLLTYAGKDIDEQFFKGSAWEQLTQTCLRHPRLAQHLNQIFGSPYTMSGGWDLHSLCLSLLPAPRWRAGVVEISSDYNPATFVRGLIDELNSEHVKLVSIWPIAGVWTDTELELDTRLALRPLTDKEKAHFLNSGAIAPMHRDTQVVQAAEASWCGLVGSELLRKEFGGTSELPKDFEEWHAKRDVVLEDFLAMIPMLGEYFAIHAGGYQHAPRLEVAGQLARGVTTRAANGNSWRFLHHGSRRSLTSEDRQTLMRLWPVVNSSQGSTAQRRVVNAIKRHYLAETRLTVEDKLIDYMIAAESLFLDSDKDELSYRLSMNAAAWCSSTINSKKSVFELFRKAYAARSKVVHGSQIEGDVDTAFLNEIRVTLLRGIVRALHGLNNGKYPPDWDGLLFSEGQ